MRDGQAVGEGGRHEALSLKQEVGDHLSVEAKIGGDPSDGGRKNFLFRGAGDLGVDVPLVKGSIQTELVQATRFGDIALPAKRLTQHPIFDLTVAKSEFSIQLVVGNSVFRHPSRNGALGNVEEGSDVFKLEVHKTSHAIKDESIFGRAQSLRRQSAPSKGACGVPHL